MFCLLLAALCAAAAPVRAAGDVRIIQSGTLGNVFGEGGWVAVQTLLANDGAKARDVQLVLSVREDRRVAQYRRSVYLPSHCEIQVVIRACIHSLAGAKAQVLDGRGALLAERTVTGVPLPWQRLVFFMIGEQPSLPALKRTVWTRASTLKGPLPLALALSEHREPLGRGSNCQDMPEHWAGYEGAAGVVVGPMPRAALRPRQVQTLRDMVEGGGLLLFFPGSRPETLVGSPLEPLLPVRIVGMRKQQHLTFTGGGATQEAVTPLPVDVIESEAVPGAEVIYRDGEVPLIVRKRLGLGEIYFFAFSGPVLESYPETAEVMAEALLHRSYLKPFNVTALRLSAHEALGEIAGAKVAPPQFVIATLGLYVVIVALALGITRRMNRMELAWIVIIPASVGFAYVSHRAGSALREEMGLSANELSVSQCAAGATRARRYSLVGIHATDALQGVLKVSDPGTGLASGHGLAPARTQTGVQVFDCEPEFRLQDFGADAGSAMQYYRADSYVDLDGRLEARMQLGPGGVSAVIKNATSQDMTGVMVVASGYPFDVGDLPAGKERRLVLTHASGRERHDFASSNVLGSRERMRHRVIEGLYGRFSNRTNYSWVHKPHLLAWLERAAPALHLEPTSGPSPEYRTAALLLAEGAVMPAPAGTEVTIPRAFVPVGVRIMRKGPFARPENDVSPEQERDVAFFLPEFAWNVKLQGATVRLSIAAPGHELDLIGRDKDSDKAIVLASVKDFSGEWTVDVKAPGRFAVPRLRALLLHVVAKTGDGRRPADGLPGWVLKDASATLRGTAF